MERKQRTNLNIIVSVLSLVMVVALLCSVFYFVSNKSYVNKNITNLWQSNEDTQPSTEQAIPPQNAKDNISGLIQDEINGGSFLASPTDSATSYTYNGVTYTTTGYTNASGTHSYTGTRNMSSGAWAINSNGVYYATGTATAEKIGNNAGINIHGTVTLVLYNCTITTGATSPIHINTNANVTLIVLGTCKMTAGSACAGIHVPNPSTITIAGNGTINATGGNGEGGFFSAAYHAGAGIGGNGEGDYHGCGTVKIDGDVTVVAKGGNGSTKSATDGQNGAGIGGGGKGDGGSVTIEGNAVVTATAGGVTGSGDPIGSGGKGDSNGSIATDDNAIVNVSDLPDSLVNDLKTNNGGIVIVDDTATIYGDITFTEDYTFPSDVENILIAESAKPVEIAIDAGATVNFNKVSDDFIETIGGDSKVVLKVSSKEGVEDGKLVGYYGENGSGSKLTPLDASVPLSISMGNIFIGTATYNGETLQRFYQSTEVETVVVNDELDDSLNWIYVKQNNTISITGTSEYSNNGGNITEAYVVEVVRGTHTIEFDNLHIVAYEKSPLEVGTFYNAQIDAVNLTLNLTGENRLFANGETPAIKYGEQSSLTINGNTSENYLTATSAGDNVVLDNNGNSNTSTQMMQVAFIESDIASISEATEFTLKRFDSSGSLISSSDFDITPEQVAEYNYKSIAFSVPSTEAGDYYMLYVNGVEINAVTDAIYSANKNNTDYDYSDDYISEFAVQANTITKYWQATTLLEEFLVTEGAYYRRINSEADISALAENVSNIPYDGVVTVVLKSAKMVLNNGNLIFDVQGTIPAGTKMTIVTFVEHKNILGCNSYTLQSDLTDGTLSTAEFTNIVGSAYSYNAKSVDIKLVLDFKNSDMNTARSNIILSFINKKGADNAVEIAFKEDCYTRTLNAYLSDTEGTALTSIPTQKSTIAGYTAYDSYIVGNDVSFDLDLITTDFTLPEEAVDYVAILEFFYFEPNNVEITLFTHNAVAQLECAVFGKEVVINGFSRSVQTGGNGKPYMLSEGVITFMDMPAGDYMVTAKLVKKVEVCDNLDEQVDWTWCYPEATDTMECAPILFTVVSPILVVEREDTRIINVTKNSQDLIFEVEKSAMEDASVTTYCKDENGDYVPLATQWAYQTNGSNVTVTVPKDTPSGTYRIEFSTTDAHSVYYNVII